MAFLLSQYGAWAHHISMATQTLHLSVRGMTCGNCARSVERTSGVHPGCDQGHGGSAVRRATVEYDADLVKPESLANAVRDLGYEVPA